MTSNSDEVTSLIVANAHTESQVKTPKTLGERGKCDVQLESHQKTSCIAEVQCTLGEIKEMALTENPSTIETVNDEIYTDKPECENDGEITSNVESDAKTKTKYLTELSTRDGDNCVKESSLMKQLKHDEICGTKSSHQLSASTASEQIQEHKSFELSTISNSGQSIDYVKTPEQQKKQMSLKLNNMDDLKKTPGKNVISQCTENKQPVNAEHTFIRPINDGGDELENNAGTYDDQSVRNENTLEDPRKNVSEQVVASKSEHTTDVNADNIEHNHKHLQNKDASRNEQPRKDDSSNEQQINGDSTNEQPNKCDSRKEQQMNHGTRNKQQMKHDSRNEQPKNDNSRNEQQNIDDSTNEQQMNDDNTNEQLRKDDSSNEQPKKNDSRTEQPKTYGSTNKKPKGDDSGNEQQKKDEGKSDQENKDDSRSEQPKKDYSRSEQPKKDDSGNEQLKKDEGKSDQENKDGSRSEQPKKEDSGNEQQKKDAGKSDQENKDDSGNEQPNKYDSRSEQPNKDDSRSDQENKDDIRSEQPKKDDSRSEQPKKEDSGNEQLKKDNSRKEQQKIDNSTNKQPKGDDSRNETEMNDDSRNEQPKKDEGKSDQGNQDDSRSEQPKKDYSGNEQQKKDDSRKEQQKKDDNRNEPEINDDSRNEQPKKDEGKSDQENKDDSRSEQPKKDDSKNEQLKKDDSTNYLGNESEAPKRPILQKCQESVEQTANPIKPNERMTLEQTKGVDDTTHAIVESIHLTLDDITPDDTSVGGKANSYDEDKLSLVRKQQLFPAEEELQETSDLSNTNVSILSNNQGKSDEDGNTSMPDNIVNVTGYENTTSNKDETATLISDEGKENWNVEEKQVTNDTSKPTTSNLSSNFLIITNEAGIEEKTTAEPQDIVLLSGMFVNHICIYIRLHFSSSE